MVPLGIDFAENYNSARIGTCRTPIVAGTTIVWSPMKEFLTVVSAPHFQYIN